MQRTIDRLKAPYTSNCTSDWSLSNLTSLVQNASIFPYNILVRISYFLCWNQIMICFSQQCRRFCLFDHFRRQCGCFFSSYLDSDSNRAMFQISKWFYKNSVFYIIKFYSNPPSNYIVFNYFSFLKHISEMTYCHAILQVVAQMKIVLVLLSKKWMQGRRNASAMSSVRNWITNYQFHRRCGHQISMRLEHTNSFMMFIWSILPLLQTLAMESYGFETGNSNKMSISSNLLKVQVFFTSLSVETVTESATYEANIKCLRNICIYI